MDDGGRFGQVERSLVGWLTIGGWMDEWGRLGQVERRLVDWLIQLTAKVDRQRWCTGRLIDWDL